MYIIITYYSELKVPRPALGPRNEEYDKFN